MRLIEESIGRRAVHTRTVKVDVYKCDDNSYDVDAEIADIPQRHIDLICGSKAAGDDLHRMRLRLHIDQSNVVQRAGAETLAGPYGEHCANHGDVYARLVGLNVLKGFRQAVFERLGGMQGCTHITELAQSVPTALIQAIAQEAALRRKEGGGEEKEQPFQLDRCHALRLDSEAVRIFYPRWYRPIAAQGDGVPVEPLAQIGEAAIPTPGPAPATPAKQKPARRDS